jgi:alpha-beta hydrolase superfamily lysophospholipase
LSASLKRRARVLFRVLTALSPALAARVAAHVFVRPRPRPLTPEDVEFLTSAQASRLRTPHGMVQVYEWPAPGPTVLVLHGWYSHTARLKVMIAALRQAGLRVVAFDAPAHGSSAGNEADLYHFHDALTAVTSAHAPIDAILAHSFGALSAATWLAEQHPASTLQAAVLVGAPRDVGYLFESFVEVLALRADVVRRLRELFCRRYGRYPEEFSATRLAQRIQAPVLLVHGEQDELVPTGHSGEIALQLPNGQVQVIGGLSHSGPLRDPQAVALMTQFLKDRLTDSRARTAPAR